MKTIYIFSWPKCKGCNALKKRLTELSIPFIDVNALAPENKELWDDFRSQTNSEAVPQVFIQEEGKIEGTVYVPSTDWNSTEEILEIIKNSI